ncbi:uncharacterized protein ARMOST_21514 [Armillaria ostoyae]|uniref:Uncharacterized protein n=1 Tax=Armillaria ostoyae TaxID=47428 RepID=A0A284SAA0_ARMOS|nr:uncharacterized protein ARMOST_21514 [Armillaria ostoyae]
MNLDSVHPFCGTHTISSNLSALRTYDEEIDSLVVLIGVCECVQSDFVCRMCRIVWTVISSFPSSIATPFETRSR